MDRSRARALACLWLLFAINTANFFDRQLFAAITEPIRREWSLSDLQIGWLSTAFILLYAVVGIPLGRLADVGRRTWLLASGLFFWSILTSASGLSRGYWSFFCFRLGIGAGEAVCAPTCTSMIGDLFRSHERGRALGIYMLGLPLGIALSYMVGGAVAQHLGWRKICIVAGIPGILLAPLAALLPEPTRGQSDPNRTGMARRAVSPYCLVLRTPAMWWIIASGAVHNFILYALSAFLPSLLVRYHKTSIQRAGFISAIVIGIIGGAGMLLGGWAGDRLSRCPSRRLLLVGIAVLTSVPAFYFALGQAAGRIVPFLALLGSAWMLMYAYYSNIYATIQDLLEPYLRGTGMAVYFLGTYALGAFMGPVATGWVSDMLAFRAAKQAGIAAEMADQVSEKVKAIGLHQALYMVPVLAALLAGILFAAAMTVRHDAEGSAIRRA